MLDNTLKRKIMTDMQKTLKGEISLKGKGLHTGAIINMTIKPASENTGIVFVRTDLEGCPQIRAIADNVTDTSRSTTIKSGEASVTTIEHLMASFYGTGVDNAIVEVSAPEIPIMDGSAKDFVEAINNIGVIDQNVAREYYTLTEKLSYSIPEKNIELSIYPDSEFKANINVDFNSSVIGMQYAAINSAEEVCSELAPCRTFVFMHDIMPLLDLNLIKGGDIDNALVIVEKELPQEQIDKIKKITNNENIEVNSNGYLNNTVLNFENEIARHKLLDLVGDLFLIGCRIKGKVFASKTGHFANTEFAKIIRRQMKKDLAKPKYRYDQNAKPLYDINDIKGMLPHRPPFLLVDKIMHLDNDNIIGVKNVTMNEPFFVGHFPEEPVMPGVLIVEAMAQCGGVLVLANVDNPKEYSTYFLKIDQVKFKRKVIPGDTLVFILHLTEPIRRGIVNMEAKAYVGDQLATEALLTAQVVKNK